MKMKIPVWSYFELWATISVVFSKLGFMALDKTDIPRIVSPVILSLLKHSVAASAYLSSMYAFLSLPPSSLSPNISALLAATRLCACLYYDGFGLSFAIWVPSFVIASESIDTLFSIAPLSEEHKAYWALVNLGVGSPLALVDNEFRIMICAVAMILFKAVSWLVALQKEKFRQLLGLLARTNERLSIIRQTKKGKLVELGIGLVGTILFQNYFKLTSINHVVAFLYFAVAWLANLALARASDDMGIFYFLVGNVMVGCTVSQYGLRGTTWLVYAASLLLSGLRLVIDWVNFVENRHVTLNFGLGPDELGLPAAVDQIV